MPIILHIDTAVETASVALSDNAELVKLAANDNQYDHAAWLHKTIQSLLRDAGMAVRDINAVAVSIGPGSYTGLRVGLSAAKGLCYALDIPLITIGTLEIMATAVKNKETDLICPLIDARRMEVFTAVYDKFLTEINNPCAMVINEHSFSELLAANRMVFCGNGSQKLKTVFLNRKNAIFTDDKASAADMCPIAYRHFMEKKFSDIAYTEPLYIKEFFSTLR
ncbi:MAG TPA: tRNA (adenosine(37)-N6)-threonylcarbamoyltransferase complex dimerization subunit type 1 TsaB [Chitinophagaceae bacterium]